ncbi:expressed unknown protein [Seminavis robusta]|uniref:SAM domain-containing protein n=1 Tax=Seminavis robusta TaxID=568900 RepID=A0A9N8F5C5_9STRA|nr:expressed unknown protein [Seminavis robusta]|eukprot:Sro3263_g345980.1 n/a (235) ;mRNA; f:3287-3991
MTAKKKDSGSKDVSDMFLLNTNFEAWTCDQLAEYFKQKTGDLGGDYSELIFNHKIDGKIAHRLKESDLKDMGISNVGDRLRIMQEIEKIEKAYEQKKREQVVWEGKEVLFFNWWDRALSTCCGCFPEDASTYKLTGAHLVIKTVNPLRCGPIRCCFGTKYTIDNVDLSNVTDVDVKGVPPSCCQQCCCGATQEHVFVKTNAEATKVLKLTKEEGSSVSRKILNQVELMQRMERS